MQVGHQIVNNALDQNHEDDNYLAQGLHVSMWATKEGLGQVRVMRGRGRAVTLLT